VTPRLKRSTAAVVAVLAAVVLTSCTTYAPADHIILYYTAGSAENKDFHECIEPSGSGDYPVNDQIFALPTDVRTWAVSPKGGDTSDPMISGTLPRPSTDGTTTQAGPSVAVYATTEFYINTDCAGGKQSPVVKFWEKLGRRYGVSADGEYGFNVEGFRDLLYKTLVPAETKAMARETRKYDADTLDANLGDVFTTMERNLGPWFAQELRTKLGGDFFCGVGFERGKKVKWTEWKDTGKLNAEGQPIYEEKEVEGTCPPVRISITDINIADPEAAAARNRVYTAEQNAKADKIEAQAQKDKADTLEDAANNPGYVELERIEAERSAAERAAEACERAKNCTLIVGDSGVGVNVPGGR
jgi:hypothetical protein